MQSASPTLVNSLNNGYVNKALPKLVVEWNQNRYAGILAVDNNPSDASVGADIENYPISSIVEAQRPKRGIIKARTSTARSLPLFWSRQRTIVTGEEGFTAEDFSDRPPTNRYYTVGPKAGYKYWTSPQPSTYTQQSDGGFAFPSGYEVNPYVLYKTTARVNKIVVTFESSWARPHGYDIQITSNGGNSWQTIGSNLAPNSEGQVILYRQTTGFWNTGVNRGTVTTINGIRLVVRTINRPDAHLNLVELSARLESDLSDYVIGYDTNYDMSEANFITPLGQSSANTGSVTLSNVDGLFNNENTSSIYYNLIDKNALFTLDLEYTLDNGSTERVREMTMYSDQWSGQSDLEVTASLKDSSKFFQEIKVPQTLLENITVGEAVWRICDSIGFLDFVYERKDTDPSASLPYFWTESEDTVWDALQQLAQATQTAIYFDEFDVLRIKSRESAYDLAKSPNWALEATNANGKLADVEEANITADYEANVVNINYKDTKVSDDNKGFPQMHVLWQPENDFVLRASRLTESITTTSTVVRITTETAAEWPYEGMFNIEGELIKYKGKEYSYYNKSGQLTSTYVESLEAKNNIDKTLTDENQAFKSTWTGRLKIEERGVYWSQPRAHAVDIQGWTGRRVERQSTASVAFNGGVVHDRNNSLLRLVSPANSGMDTVYLSARGNTYDQNYRRYGTRLRIPSTNRGTGGAGIVINNGTNEAGYYIELVPSETINANGAALRNFIHEVGFFVRYGDSGDHIRVAGKGSPAVIATDTWYDLDVDFWVTPTGVHQIVVYLNGMVHLRVNLSSGRTAVTGRFGLYHRGTGAADFEYMFAHAASEDDRGDEVSHFDKTRGGFVSGQWDREYVYGTRDANRTVGNKTVAYKQKYNQYFMDEFGPIVHEVREMDIIFEKFPVLHSRLFSTNSQAVTPEYNADPFGAKFLIANSARHNAVLNGEDLITRGRDNPLNQQMMIYGRLIFQEEGEVLTVKGKDGVEESPFRNDDSIRRRGKVEVDIDSRWIQSKAEAQALGDWILKHWSGGSDEVEASVYGNPLYQLGDVVTLDYPAKNMHRATHRYFIVGIQNKFDQGLTTSLTLRRAKI